MAQRDGDTADRVRRDPAPRDAIHEHLARPDPPWHPRFAGRPPHRPAPDRDRRPRNAAAFPPREGQAASRTEPTGQSEPTLPEQFGRYRIIKLLGRGAMGAVYLAHDSQLDRRVALKVPFLKAGDGGATQDRFSREGRAAATLVHAGICPVYDVGTHDGVPYLTMAYIEGQSLGEFLARSKQPTASPVGGAGPQGRARTGGGARAGVYHRDLKPSNIMLTMRGEPVVMDFGLAFRGDRGADRLTQEGSILGTPAYMAPEQIHGGQDAVGPAGDIYSLGVMLYEMLSGRLPFEGPVMSVLARALTEEPPTPSSHRDGVDPALETICLRAMAKKPTERYASMTDLAAAVAAFLRGGRDVTTAPVAATSSQTALSSAPDDPTFSAPGQGRTEGYHAPQPAAAG